MQDIEKETRKEVDEAIAKAKVRSMVDICYCLDRMYVWDSPFEIWIFSVYAMFFQESPMPEPSELFTNVYVKGYGVEVNFVPPYSIPILFTY